MLDSSGSLYTGQEAKNLLQAQEKDFLINDKTNQQLVLVGFQLCQFISGSGLSSRATNDVEINKLATAIVQCQHGICCVLEL